MKSLWPDDDGGLSDVFDSELVLTEPVKDRYGLICYEYRPTEGYIHRDQDWLFCLEQNGQDFLRLVDPSEHTRVLAELDRLATVIARKRGCESDGVFDLPFMDLNWPADLTDERRAEEAEIFKRLGLTVDEAKELIRRSEDSD